MGACVYSLVSVCVCVRSCVSNILAEKQSVHVCVRRSCSDWRARSRKMNTSSERAPKSVDVRTRTHNEVHAFGAERRAMSTLGRG